MNTLLAAHIIVSMALVLFTAVRMAFPAASRRAGNWRKLQVGAGVGSFASGLALAFLGASVAHMCISGALLVAIVAGIELYVRGTQRPYFSGASDRVGRGK